VSECGRGGAVEGAVLGFDGGGKERGSASMKKAKWKQRGWDTAVRWTLEELAIDRPPVESADWNGAGHEGVLWGAAGSLEITPVLGRMNSGFGPSPTRMSTGVWGGLRGTVMVIQTREGDSHSPLHVLLQLDLMTAGRWIVERVAELVTAAGHHLHPATIIPLCSHTHHGPGGVYASYIVDHLPQASQGFDRAYCEDVSQRLAQSVLGCVGRMAPVRLAMGQSSWHGLGWQRSDVAFEENDEDVRKGFLEWTRARLGEVGAQLGMSWPPASEVDSLDNFERLDSRLRTLCLFAAGTGNQSLLGAMVFTGVTPSAFATATVGSDPAVSGRDAYSPDVVGTAATMLMSTRYRGAHIGTVASGGFGDVNAVHPTLSLVEFREYRTADTRRERVDPAGEVWTGRGRLSIAGQSWLELPFEIAQAWALVIDESIQDARDCRFGFEGRVWLRNRFGEPRISQASYPRLLRYRGERARGGRLLTMPRQMRPGLSMLSASELNATLSSGILGSVGVREGIRRTLRTGKHGAKPRAFGVFSAIITGAAAPADAFITPFWGLRLLDIERRDPEATAGAAERVRLLAIPGEPCSVIATLLERELAHRDGVEDRTGVSVLVAGNAGDYQGYITTPQEYQTQQYEGAATYWGIGTAEWLLSRVAALDGRNLPHLVGQGGSGQRNTEFANAEEWEEERLQRRLNRECYQWREEEPVRRALFATSLLAYGVPEDSRDSRVVLRALVSRADVVQTRQVSLLSAPTRRTRFSMRGSDHLTGFSAAALLVSVHWEMPMGLLGISPTEVVVTLEVTYDPSVERGMELMWQQPGELVGTVVSSKTAQALRWAEEAQPDDDGDTTSLFWSCFFRLHSLGDVELLDSTDVRFLVPAVQPRRWIRARIDAPSLADKLLTKTAWKEVVWR
jgi:hypothetical protein